MTTNALTEFEQHLKSNPSDTASWAVYADALMENKDTYLQDKFIALSLMYEEVYKHRFTKRDPTRLRLGHYKERISKEFYKELRSTLEALIASLGYKLHEMYSDNCRTAIITLEGSNSSDLIQFHHGVPHLVDVSNIPRFNKHKEPFENLFRFIRLAKEVCIVNQQNLDFLASSPLLTQVTEAHLSYFYAGDVTSLLSSPHFKAHTLKLYTFGNDESPIFPELLACKSLTKLLVLPCHFSPEQRKALKESRKWKKFDLR